METSIQNYFWLVDRLSIEDDSRNKVNAESETVTLSTELEQGLLDGKIFGKLLSQMHRTFTMRTGQSFQIPQQPLQGSRDANWESLIPSLRNFGVQINENKSQRLKQGEQMQLSSLLTTLFEIDTSPIPQRVPPNQSQSKLDTSELLNLHIESVATN